MQFYSVMIDLNKARSVKKVRILLPTEECVRDYLWKMSNGDEVDFNNKLQGYRSEMGVVETGWKSASQSLGIDINVHETSIFPYGYFAIFNAHCYMFGYYKYERNSTLGLITDRVFFDEKSERHLFNLPHRGAQGVFDQLWASSTPSQRFPSREPSQRFPSRELVA